MRARISFLLVVLLAILLGGCASNTPAATPALTDSLKGYELYSWQDGGEWNFSLLVGTNREKTLDEIKAPPAVLSGLDALKPALESLPSGQYVSWTLKESLAFPPEDLLNQVRQICEEHGLILTIAP